jgi:hypothetical protein
MKIFGKILTGLLLGVLCSVSAWAMDFSRMSNQDLADLQGAIRNAPEADQAAFRLEWEKRQASMSEEEKKLYPSPPEPQPGEEEQMKKPYIQGRGYDSQGTGTVIFGGVGTPGQGGADGKK